MAADDLGKLRRAGDLRCPLPDEWFPFVPLGRIQGLRVGLLQDGEAFSRLASEQQPGLPLAGDPCGAGASTRGDGAWTETGGEDWPTRIQSTVAAYQDSSPILWPAMSWTRRRTAPARGPRCPSGRTGRRPQQGAAGRPGQCSFPRGRGQSARPGGPCRAVVAPLHVTLTGQRSRASTRHPRPATVVARIPDFSHREALRHRRGRA